MNEIITLSKKLSKFVVCAEGNISKRVKNNFIIKASGTHLKTLKKEDIVTCDMNGIQLDNFNKKPSMEYLFHSWLYSFNNINFVAHTHPINTLKILCTNSISDFSEKRLFPEQIVFNGKKSCIVPYANPGKELLNCIKEHVTSYVEKEKEIPKLILLQNHGIIAVSKTANECISITEICEKSAEIYLGSILNPNYLSNKDIDKIFNDENEKYRQKLNSKGI
jgi:ribulose-5-phosphate 4-epimerase/fuculose-1-phosphate aldolase